MNPPRAQLLEQALELTRRRLENARAGDWQPVICAEAERRLLLEQAFATRDLLDEALAAKVRQLLDLDRDLIEASTRARDELGGELGQITRGNRASQAYHAHSAG